MWRVALVPGPAAAGSRSDTRRHQVSGISCLLPCPLCEYSVGLQSHNPPRALATLFFIYLLCLGGNLYHRGATHLKMDQSAVSQVFLPHPPPPIAFVFSAALVRTVLGMHITQQIPADSVP